MSGRIDDMARQSTGLITFLLVVLVLAATAAIVKGAPVESCGPMPTAPPQTEATAVQRAETLWDTVVPGWVKAPAPACWTLGQVELRYDNTADATLVQEPTPWAEGLDYPKGSACPAAAVAGCYQPQGITP